MLLEGRKESKKGRNPRKELKECIKGRKGNR
jgi:hypothetical protein